MRGSGRGERTGVRGKKGDWLEEEEKVSYTIARLREGCCRCLPGGLVTEGVLDAYSLFLLEMVVTSHFIGHFISHFISHAA